ncbi:uncharacterized protein LOC129732192 isoform X2 [Wyeomyia smithii]|uniref:uncharacterized protein LOC129732192 isoform X2 n=1 Tax=Wyeomyia smithii TaxID=174621 RepID=UPI002467EBB1|nr:uncharacterized protein LOC129732192 isoform X2 [Wyeomyia smithii]
MDIKHTPLEKSESSSTISIGQFEGFHDKTDTGFKNLTKKCHIPFRDQDEFSAKLNSKVASCSVSASLESGLSFIRHNIYTIDELTEDSGLSFAKVRRTTSSEDELMQRLEKLKQVTTAARAVRRPAEFILVNTVELQRSNISKIRFDGAFFKGSTRGATGCYR